MDLSLQVLMDKRMCLTRKIGFVEDNKSKYDPPLIYKEHALSHLTEDIRNLGMIDTQIQLIN